MRSRRTSRRCWLPLCVSFFMHVWHTAWRHGLFLCDETGLRRVVICRQVETHGLRSTSRRLCRRRPKYHCIHIEDQPTWLIKSLANKLLLLYYGQSKLTEAFLHTKEARRVREQLKHARGIHGNLIYGESPCSPVILHDRRKSRKACKHTVLADTSSDHDLALCVRFHCRWLSAEPHKSGNMHKRLVPTKDKKRHGRPRRDAMPSTALLRAVYFPGVFGYPVFPWLSVEPKARQSWSSM